ncbi:hypothetical protein HCH_02866 [Hahella chejuensis KCTC 2396]|uniref:Uncharacterized protein n=1 Tax=Hahella chejuensis (strain KCTC 2396) TaxID=349521 RepID=Q2SI81_HAHCH|nr:hypothetical protein [Hahella chejuensis]ABC29643.1 hypothetical protein HCH_02866 [Hahella chejuensis KCTC 2396]
MGIWVEVGNTYTGECPGCKETVQIVNRNPNDDICFCPYCATSLMDTCLLSSIDEGIDRLEGIIKRWRSRNCGIRQVPDWNSETDPLCVSIEMRRAALELAEAILRSDYSKKSNI